jgi:hypothetical protein
MKQVLQQGEGTSLSERLAEHVTSRFVVSLRFKFISFPFWDTEKENANH